MLQTVDAARRLRMPAGKDGQTHGLPAVSIAVQTSAEDASAVLPQDLQAAILPGKRGI